VQWTITSAEEALRLDTFLTQRLKPLSRAETGNLIATGYVVVNGRLAHKGVRLRIGDTVTADSLPLFRPNPSVPISVIYADKDLVVMDKPAGIASQAIRHSEYQTAANFLAAHFPETRTASIHPLESGLVHRLDTMTSGLLLAARTPSAYIALRQQFRARVIEKQYLAIVEGRISEAGTVTLALGSTGPHRQRVRVTKVQDGREAVTTYRPTKILPRHTVVQVTIYTGVRHQIRAHLAAIGHPIVGDTQYGTKGPANRLYLHAEILAFRHPTTGAMSRHQTVAPAEFAGLLRELSTPSGS
jgi:23S rRNA pseudouridine1911/1915/1917 synthase